MYRALGKSAYRLGILFALTHPMMSSPSAQAATSCENLRQVAIAGTELEQVERQEAGDYTAPDSSTLKDLPSFCRVHGVIRPVPRSKIGFVLWLPEQGWNGKFQMFGNGGYSSKIAYASLAEQLRRGYAVAGTDTGHSGDDPDFAAGNPETIVDWGHRAVHQTAVTAKAIIAARYDQSLNHSYFSGCSTGGQQAFMEAQRYPKDFDGILAGDPGHNRTHLNAGFLWQFVANRSKTSGALIPPEKLAAVSAAVFKACVGRDGGLSTDKFLTAPEECHFQPKDIQCTASDQPECLTGEQVGAFEAMYRGARDPRSGEVIYYSWPKGSENSGRVVKSLPGWSLYWADPAHPDLPARSNFWKLWAFDNPNWNWTMFDFGADMKAVDDRLAANINAMNSDLTAFRAADGKMIHYHGLSDPVVPPRDSIDYFEDVQRNLVKSSAGPADASANFYRLFLAPGMEHCRGGDGPNVLDAQRALEEWVEQVKSPDTIAATKFVNDKPADGIALSRPLCPYPQEARYTGRGDPNSPENFACQPGHRYPEPLTGKLYRR
jgi:feruloyl esterase